MSQWDLTDDAEWGGRPVARRVAETTARQRVVITGTICQAGPITVGGTPSYRLVVDDGTGRITVVFIGRRAVPGLVDGTRCSVEGPAQRARGRLEVWNPHYRVEGPTADTARPGCGAP